MVNKLEAQRPLVTVTLLGDWAVVSEDWPIVFTSTKGQALLIYLALTGRPHTRLALASLLWPEKQDKDALANLRQAIYALRRTLPDLVIATRERVGLHPDRSMTIDVQRFERYARDGLAGDVEALCNAADCYRGDLLHGFFVEDAEPFEEWLRGERERLHRTAFQVLQLVTTYFVDQRATRRGIPYAEQLLGLEPWHEEGHYQLMQLLAWSGQTQAALAQYEQCRHVLATELNTQPSAKVETLVDALRQGQIMGAPQPIRYQPTAQDGTIADPVGRAFPTHAPHSTTNLSRAPRQHRDFTAMATEATPDLSIPDAQGSKNVAAGTDPTGVSPPHNLPHHLASLIGRSQEITALCTAIMPSPATRSAGARVTTQRLLTLVGPGGVGKTRLAQQVGSTVLTNFRDGVWFVDLAILPAPSLILQAIADLLAIRDEGALPLLDSLCARLTGKSLLLIWDNCEHLAPGCAALAEELLNHLPQLQILATSRQPLHTFGERLFAVPPLSLPDEQAQMDVATLLDYAGVRLFVERAATVVPGFALTAKNCHAIVEICRWLDGLPLAIELVAARTRVLTVEQIVEQLRNAPTAQLHLGANGRQAASARHRTLRSLIDWSYQLLPHAEQLLLQRMTVFVGSSTYATVLQICAKGATDDVSAVPHEQLIEPWQILDLLDGLVDKSLVVAEQSDTVVRYRLLESIRQYALEKLIAAGDEKRINDRHLQFYVHFAETVAAQFRTMPRATWLARIRAELENVRGALNWAYRSHAAAAGLRISNAMGHYWFTQGLHRESIRWIEQLLAVSDQPLPDQLRLATLSNLGFTYWWVLEDYQKAISLLQEILKLASTLGDQMRIEKTLNDLGGIATRRHDYATARQHLSQSRALSAQSGNQNNYAWSQILLGETAMGEGDEHAATDAFQQAAAVLRRLNARNLLAYPIRRLGQLAQQQGAYQRALTYYRESLLLNYTMTEPEGTCASLVSYARLFVVLGKWQYAIRLCAAVDTAMRVAQLRLPFVERHHYAELCAELQQMVGENEFTAAWAEGAFPLLDSAVAAVQQWEREITLQD